VARGGRNRWVSGWLRGGRLSRCGGGGGGELQGYGTTWLQAAEIFRGLLLALLRAAGLVDCLQGGLRRAGPSALMKIHDVGCASVFRTVLLHRTASECAAGERGGLGTFS
jgi:hypothetical protein